MHGRKALMHGVNTYIRLKSVKVSHRCYHKRCFYRISSSIGLNNLGDFPLFFIFVGYLLSFEF